MLNTVIEAINDIKSGKVVIVVDDENRENEGDFVTAAENITPELINFMSIQGRGLICVPLTPERCKELDLELMVKDNTSLHHTQFTVSVDVKSPTTSTGISASDRSETVMALINEKTTAQDLARPGHIFPLIAHPQGLKARPGHTEAAIELSKLAGFKPGAVIVEILNPDGSMARLPDLKKLAKELDLKIISIEALLAFIS